MKSPAMMRSAIRQFFNPYNRHTSVVLYCSARRYLRLGRVEVMAKSLASARSA